VDVLRGVFLWPIHVYSNCLTSMSPVDIMIFKYECRYGSISDRVSTVRDCRRSFSSKHSSTMSTIQTDSCQSSYDNLEAHSDSDDYSRFSLSAGDELLIINTVVFRKFIRAGLQFLHIKSFDTACQIS